MLVLSIYFDFFVWADICQNVDKKNMIQNILEAN